MMKEELRISMIIELLRDQHPGRTDLIEHLESANDNLKWTKNGYIELVPADRPNEKGSEWQFDENLLLEHDEFGTIILDVLKDGRVGGIEFWRKESDF